MGKKKNDNEMFRTGSAERMIFGLGEKQPIRIIHHYFLDKQNSRYDMHYGLELGILLRGKMRRYYQGYRADILPGQVWLCGMWEPHGWQVTKSPCEAVVLMTFPPMLAGTHFENMHNIKWINLFNVLPKERPQVKNTNRKIIVEIGKYLKKDFSKKANLQMTWWHLKLLEILLILQDNWGIKSIPKKEFPDSFAKINTVLQLVFENYSLITTWQAAQVCGMNRNSFASMFSEIMGISFSEFNLRYRIDGAAQQLNNSDNPVKTIAAKWGFTDTSHLHRCFKKYYGCSPSEYRMIS
jgi:AraC-like DNA-binding protein